MRENEAHLGIALDGDGDRLVVADSEGRLYDGDQLLYAIIRHRAAHEKVTGVVGTLMTNLALEQALATVWEFPSGAPGWATATCSS